MNEIVSIFVSLLIVVSITAGLKKIAERYQSAKSHLTIKSGVGGVMLIFIAGQIAVLLRLVVQVVYLYSGLQTIHAAVVDRLIILMPTVVSVLLGLMILFQLITVRRASAPALTIIALWVMGPVLVPLQSWFFSQPVSVVTLSEIFGWALFWTVYLVLSPRVALTYGTKRSRRYSKDNL